MVQMWNGKFNKNELIGAVRKYLNRLFFDFQALQKKWSSEVIFRILIDFPYK